MTSTLDDRLFAFLADIMAVPAERISLDLCVGDIPEWDSLTQTRIILGLEKDFGLQLDVDDILNLESVQDILDLLHERLPS